MSVDKMCGDLCEHLKPVSYGLRGWRCKKYRKKLYFGNYNQLIKTAKCYELKKDLDFMEILKKKAVEHDRQINKQWKESWIGYFNKWGTSVGDSMHNLKKEFEKEIDEVAGIPNNLMGQEETMKEYKLVKRFCVRDLMQKRKEQYKTDTPCPEFDADMMRLLVITDGHTTNNIGQGGACGVFSESRVPELLKELPKRPNLTRHLIEWGYIEEKVEEIFKEGDCIKMKDGHSYQILVTHGNPLRIILQGGGRNRKTWSRFDFGGDMDGFTKISEREYLEERLSKL